jgi:phosphate starvation-inducible protein PhoH
MRLKAVPAAPAGIESQTLHFDDNGLCARLFGGHHEHLALIEQHIPVHLAARGNLVTIGGEPEAVEAASGAKSRRSCGWSCAGRATPSGCRATTC